MYKPVLAKLADMDLKGADAHSRWGKAVYSSFRVVSKLRLRPDMNGNTPSVESGQVRYKIWRTTPYDLGVNSVKILRNFRNAYCRRVKVTIGK